MSDAAANLMIAARDAVDSYEGLRNNTNTSNTALAQSQVAGTVTQGHLTARHGAVDGLSGGERGGPVLRTRDRPAARRWLDGLPRDNERRSPLRRNRPGSMRGATPCGRPCCMDHPEGYLIIVFFNTGDNLDAT